MFALLNSLEDCIYYINGINGNTIPFALPYCIIACCIYCINVLHVFITMLNGSITNDYIAILSDCIKMITTCDWNYFL